MGHLNCLRWQGKVREGVKLVLLTFKGTLSPSSPIYPWLSACPLLDLHIGHDDITCDKDWKHIGAKQPCNALLHERASWNMGHVSPSVKKKVKKAANSQKKQPKVRTSRRKVVVSLTFPEFWSLFLTISNFLFYRVSPLHFSRAIFLKLGTSLNMSTQSQSE
jgi:hypothetical protein